MAQVHHGAAEQSPLETEILQEKAETLLRISRTLSGILDELVCMKERVPALEGREREEGTRRFNSLCDQAELYFWYLLVQREALGLRHHDGLEEFYPIPRRLERVVTAERGAYNSRSET